MSTVAEIIDAAQGGKLVENLAEQFGLTKEQTRAAVEALAPALALGLRNAAADPEALDKLVSDVAHPVHAAAFLDPAAAAGEETGAIGQAAVANLFGSGSAAGQMAQVAARDAGLRPDILARLLPVLASVVLGGLFKSLDKQGLGSILGQLAEAGGLGSILGQLGGGAPKPQSQAGGGLGGLLGALLGILLRGGGRPAGQPSTRADAPSLPGGFDPAGLEAAIEQIKKTLNPEGNTPPAPARDAELQDVLDRVFPRK
ncbi:DUF937 domain-containing protein [Methylocystis heyeri]|uniref:DUF937 domain-containing protein n=1 Tax=Methylocystis heyeri TaxID=391905 RepID=A0A6B8KK99_9HYPH|nr:DUF937 domain-containing protein [Methylocystis heyeri]QGM47023.1 DUF937 domain-containing protein [Methylocystis heyeri]